MTETESMATVCPSSTAPQVAVTYTIHAFDKEALRPKHQERSVWRARQRHISGQGWVGVDECEGWRGAGARVQAVRLAGDGPPKAPRDNV